MELTLTYIVLGENKVPVLVTNSHSWKFQFETVRQVSRCDNSISQVLIHICHKKGDCITEQNKEDDQPVNLTSSRIGKS